MTISILSDVKMQYFVRMFRMVCLAKNVLAKSTKSGMIRLLASAQNEVNSKLLLVLPCLDFGAVASLMALKRVEFE